MHFMFDIIFIVSLVIHLQLLFQLAQKIVRSFMAGKSSCVKIQHHMPKPSFQMSLMLHFKIIR